MFRTTLPIQERPVLLLWLSCGYRHPICSGLPKTNWEGFHLFSSIKSPKNRVYLFAQCSDPRLNNHDARNELQCVPKSITILVKSLNIGLRNSYK